MHQNRFRLGLRLRPRLQRSPDPLAGFKRAYFYGKGGEGKREGKAGGGEEGEGSLREGRREGTPVCIFKFSLE